MDLLNMDYKYKFSVIIVNCNNKENYEKTIASIIKQDINFKNNIEIIIVDTKQGESEEIYYKYKQEYPNNFKYYKDNNNLFLAQIEGKYVDYKLDNNAYKSSTFSDAWVFFENNNKKIDLVVYGIEEEKIDIDSYKGKIIDIYKRYNIVNLKNIDAFVKTEEIKQLNDLDCGMNFNGKILDLQRIAIEKRKIGFLENITYKDSRKAFNITDVELYYKILIEESIRKYNCVIPYIQYQIMYDINDRIKLNNTNFDDDKLVNIIKNTLKFIDDDIIMEQKNITHKYKILFLSIKYGRDIRKELKVKNNNVYFNNIYVTNLKNNYLFKIHILDIKKDKLILEGQIDCILHEEDYKIFIKETGKRKKEIKLIDDPLKNKDSIVGIFHKGKRYKIELPLQDESNFKIIMRYKEFYEIKLSLNFGKFAKMNNDIESSYYYNKQYLIKQSDDVICIEKALKGIRKQAEKVYQDDLKKINEKQIIRYRKLYFITKKIIKKPIWLISDRTNMANDNGIHLFKYLAKHEKKAKVYFVIDKKSKDYKKVKKIGKVIPHNSFKYKLYFLLASKIISSQADEWVQNAFDEKEKYIKDLYKFKFIFLQHGITKDDLSKWLNRFNKNISLFITSTEKEYDSIINGNYLYTDKQVKLTGFPRYDVLQNRSAKQIIFMPTWRKNIVNNRIVGTSIREYNEQFKQSEYCIFYNKLINDERIKKALKEYNYIAKFYVHPSAIQQYMDFESNEYVKVMTEVADYQKEFAKSNLLITDYSSVAFDFAYLKKLVIYTQFDKDVFFENHLYNKGYFSYEKDGFGPVCYNYETSVKEIVKAIENNCKLEQKYIERIDNFYTYNDRENCRRVHKEILKLK